MRNVIIHQGFLPDILYRLLPEHLLAAIGEALPPHGTPEEIRLRCGRCASITVQGENLRLSTVWSGKELEQLLLRLCEGSPYAHEETLREGYLVLEGGVRVGVCGRATVQEGRLTGVSAPTALVLRIPCDIPQNGIDFGHLLRSLPKGKGLLIYAPPGGGKTTALRCAAVALAGGSHPLRVAVVDTRRELLLPDDPALLVDVLSAYPKHLGISIAARTLGAEVILTDEIGTKEEAEAILNAQTCGVPLLATAHGSDLSELLRRPAMRLLHQARCFGAYAGLSRTKEGQSLAVTSYEAADALL